MNTNFTAIGQLVTEARNLLDSIKGGAIRTMQTQFDALKSSIASEWNGIKTKMNNEALAAIRRVDTGTVRDEMGFLALNYNNDYRDTKNLEDQSGFESEFPLGISFPYNLTKYLRGEIIPVKSGDDPATRAVEAKELLDFMGLGRDTKYLAYGGFNILKMTVIALPTDTPDLTPWMHLTSDHHQATRNGLTAMHYQKSPYTDNQWKRLTRVYKHGGGTNSEYYHFDVHPLGNRGGEIAVGDVLYFALPTIVAGEFPKSEMHSTLPNLRNKQVRDDKVITKRFKGL